MQKGGEGVQIACKNAYVVNGMPQASFVKALNLIKKKSKLKHSDTPSREISYPSETVQNEHTNKPGTTPLVPEDRINDITWRGSKCLCVLQMSNA